MRFLFSVLSDRSLTLTGCWNIRTNFWSSTSTPLMKRYYLKNWWSGWKKKLRWPRHWSLRWSLLCQAENYLFWKKIFRFLNRLALHWNLLETGNTWSPGSRLTFLTFHPRNCFFEMLDSMFRTGIQKQQTQNWCWIIVPPWLVKLL